MCPAAVYLIGVGSPFAAGFRPAVGGPVWEPADGTGAVFVTGNLHLGARDGGVPAGMDAATFALVEAGQSFQSVGPLQRLHGNPGFAGGAVPPRQLYRIPADGVRCSGH